MEFTSFTEKDAFSPVFSSERLLHSYIVIAPAGPVRRAFVETLAAAMICEGSGAIPCGVCRSCKKSFRGLHPDIISVYPPDDKKEIPISVVRGIRAEAAIMPNEASGKVFIVENADWMNPAAQNAFLKTLEEPPRQVHFILAAENPAALLETVRSRCAELRLLTDPPAKDGSARELAEGFFKAVKGGDMALAKFAFSIEKLSRDAFADFVSEARAMSVELLKSGAFGAPAILRINGVLDEASRYLKYNVNPVHISSLFCAGLSEAVDTPVK